MRGGAPPERVVDALIRPRAGYVVPPTEVQAVERLVDLRVHEVHAGIWRHALAVDRVVPMGGRGWWWAWWWAHVACGALAARYVPLWAAALAQLRALLVHVAALWWAIGPRATFGLGEAILLALPRSFRS